MSSFSGIFSSQNLFQHFSGLASAHSAPWMKQYILGTRYSLSLYRSAASSCISSFRYMEMSCYAPCASRSAGGEVGKSVYVNSYKVFIINQQIIVAVATTAILLAQSGFDVALAIIAVVFVGNLDP